MYKQNHFSPQSFSTIFFFSIFCLQSSLSFSVPFIYIIVHLFPLTFLQNSVQFCFLILSAFLKRLVLIFYKFYQLVPINSIFLQTYLILLSMYPHTKRFWHMYCYELNCVPPPSSYTEVLPPVSWNVTMCGDRGFKEAIKVNEVIRVLLIQDDLCLCKMRIQDKDAHREKAL